MTRLWAAAAIGSLTLACSGGSPTSPSPISTACMPTASSARAVTPIFSRPFRGEFPTGALFDHDKPVPFGDGNDYLVSMCGARAPDQDRVNGHDGYDWRMTEGTPLLSVAGGVVTAAGLSAPSFCPPLDRTVQALFVTVQHVTPGGEEFVSVYGHLSRVDVAAGQSIDDGAVLGLSGNTGCSGTPHLHFGVYRRLTADRYAVIDPYGWHAAATDPWEADPRGAASVWLWRDGAAPSLR